MFGYVFFDLDGTLLNTLDDLADASNYALKTLGFETFETERYKYFVGNGIPKLIERILPENSGSELRGKAYSLFSEYYSVHSEDKTVPYDGIPELIDGLYKAGIKTAVITNKDNIFAGKLIRRFFGNKITAVYGSVPGKPHKPDPYLVNTAIREMNADRNDILYVGDSGVDMQTAANAGLVSAGVLWGFRKEDELRKYGAVHICNFPDAIYKLSVE